MRTGRRKTWREKRADDKDLPKVVKITGRMQKHWGEGTCAIASPREVDALIRRIPKGRIAIIDDLRAAIARKHGATMGCPITTGIFAWIAAHAAEEDRANGRKRVTPWWRTLKANGALNPKYPGGVRAQARHLRLEGHRILHGRGSKPDRIADADTKRVSVERLLGAR